MFGWLFASSRKAASAIPELSMRASIVAKLKKYNADEDTTISEFSLAADDNRKKPLKNMPSARKNDVWGQANPSESGIWSREDRHKKHK